MKILVTGACGFVGSEICKAFREQRPKWKLVGVDNFSRAGSERNRSLLMDIGVDVRHCDVRVRNDVQQLGGAGWIIDAAGLPAVTGGLTNPEAVVENNLLGTVNLLELCRVSGAGMVFLSTSRVYSVASIDKHYSLWPDGFSEVFPTDAPISIYGATKLASEILISEYANAFQFPYYINRCGVMAGAGQFGTGEQGIFSWWIRQWKAQKPLSYFGYEGRQVRDCLHPVDLAALIIKQVEGDKPEAIHRDGTYNVGGGIASARSLLQLSKWCTERIGPGNVFSVTERRPYDVSWLVLDCAKARQTFGWTPTLTPEQIWEEIAEAL